MSVSLTDEISNCVKWIINNNEIEGVFNLVSESFKRKYFYDKLFDIIHKKKIDWNNENKINKDYYFSMDENPLLPNSQRFNMKVDCDKIVKSGYKFKYKNKYQLFDAIKNYQL
jgi:NAD dependent epimerase/dehydratase family enzyme